MMSVIEMVSFVCCPTFVDHLFVKDVPMSDLEIKSKKNQISNFPCFWSNNLRKNTSKIIHDVCVVVNLDIVHSNWSLWHSAVNLINVGIDPVLPYITDLYITIGVCAYIDRLSFTITNFLTLTVTYTSQHNVS